MVSNRAVERGARQAAAITLKNFIFKYWISREENGVTRAAIFDAHSEETHGLRIKATQLAAQLEALRRREQDMQEEIQ